MIRWQRTCRYCFGWLVAAAMIGCSGSASDGKPIAGFTFVAVNAQGYPEYTHDQSNIRFVRLPGGSFQMGSPPDEEGRHENEGPVHTVSLSPFLIAKYEVTQKEYEGVMGVRGASSAAGTPSFRAEEVLNATHVSWYDLHMADGFLARTGLVLPSEAQWEYACRAGTSGPYAGNGNLDDMGWHGGNSGHVTHVVGGKQANQFGLHDMHGNVHEWCEDAYDGEGYEKWEGVLPDFARHGLYISRVIRGGSYYSEARNARSAMRGHAPQRLELGVYGGGTWSVDQIGIGTSGLINNQNCGFRPAMPLP